MTASVAPLGANTPLLQANGLSKTYAGIRVLNGINLTLWPGQILALVGENGAGKSTIIKILSGAIRADEGGTVLLNGRKIELESPLDAERAEIVTVYQELSLFPALSVTENLFYADFHRMKGRINWPELHRQAEAFLREFGVDLPVRKLVSTLSIADRQMLEIAKALHRRAKIMILDEPTAVLGGADVDRLLGMVKELQKRDVAVIFVSHRLNEIFGLADSFLVLRDGQQIAAGHIDETNPDDLVSKMVGRHIAKDFVRRDHDRAEELLRVEGLSTTNATALHDISFTLRKGEVLGIAGLRGAGRTELVRAIFGADPIAAGRIFVHGTECRIGSPRTAIAHGLGLVPEDRGGQGLFRNLSSWQNMFMASDKSRWISRRREKVAAEKHVGKLQIKLPSLQTSVGALSGGNQQKVVLAKWLEAGTKILLLDEPTRGIDVGSKAQIYALVRELCSHGMGVILISSELPEVIENSDRILVMYKGGIAGELHHSQATEEAIIKYAVGGAIQ